MCDGAGGAGEEGGLSVGDKVPVCPADGCGGNDLVIDRWEEGQGWEVQGRRVVGWAGVVIRDIVSPLILRPPRLRGLGAFRVSLNPLIL